MSVLKEMEDATKFTTLWAGLSIMACNPIKATSKGCEMILAAAGLDPIDIDEMSNTTLESVDQLYKKISTVQVLNVSDLDDTVATDNKDFQRLVGRLQMAKTIHNLLITKPKHKRYEVVVQLMKMIDELNHKLTR